MLVCAYSHNIAHETAGAARTPVSPAPSFLGETICKTRAKRAAGRRRCVFVVPALSRDPQPQDGVLPEMDATIPSTISSGGYGSRLRAGTTGERAARLTVIARSEATRQSIARRTRMDGLLRRKGSSQ